MANNDIRVNVSADVREAEAALKGLEDKFDKFQKASENSSGSSMSSASREIEEAARRFQESYSNFTSSIQVNMDKMTNSMGEFDRQLEKAQSTLDTKMIQSIQAQQNAINTQTQMYRDMISEANDLLIKQQQMLDNGSRASISAGGGGGSFGGGGNGGFSGPIYSGMPNSFNPNRSGGSNDVGNYGGGGGSVPPPSSGGGSSTSDGSGGSGGNGNSGISISDLLGGYMGVRVTHGIFSSLNAGYNLMDRDERTAYSIAQKTGDYYSNFTQARRDIEAAGLATGHTMSETAQTASIYETIGGVTNTKNSLADVQAMQQFGRAYAVDPNVLAGAAGNMNRIGATQEGEQQKFASMIAQSIKEQGMSGRESELIESTNQLAQNVANAKTTVNSGDLNGIMAMQNIFGQMSPQLKGSQGASVLATMNSNIQNADNGMQLLLGRNTEFTGPEGMLALRRQMEKGISDPQNLSRILQNSEKMAGGNKSYQEMILMDKLGISSSVADQLLSKDNYDDLKSGKRAQNEIEKITGSNGDLDSKYSKYSNSDVNRRDRYNANKENSSKATGDIEDDIVTPWQDVYNNVGTAGQIEMNMLGGLAGAGVWSMGSKLFGSLFKGKFGDLFKGKGPSGGGSGGSGGAAAGEEAAEGGSFFSKIFGSGASGAEGADVAGGLAGGLSSAKGILGKVAGPVAAGLSLYAGIQGWSKADEDFKTDSPNTTQKLSSAEGAAINELTFGIPDKIFGKGATARFLYDPLGLDTPANAAERDSTTSSTTTSSGDTVNRREDQQKEWKDILQTEADVVKRREDLNKNSQSSQSGSSSSADATSNFWNNANSVNNSSDQQPQQKSWLDEIGDWFSGLFGGGSSSGGSSSGGKFSGNVTMTGNYKTGTGKISDNINALRDKVQTQANNDGIGNMTDLLMAQMMQESGGNSYEIANDPMQAAEGHGLAAGALHDQNKSIEWGVQEFADRLKDSNGDVSLALQSYNFGSGFIDYVNKHGGKMTQDLIDQFSDEQAASHGWKSYGDKQYVQHVMQYYNGKSFAIGTKSLNEDGLIYAHKGEQIVRADENPYNPSNVSTSTFINGITGSAGSVSTGIGGNLNLTITVNGQGFTSENQNKVAQAAIQVINNNQPQLLDLLANGTTRKVR